MMIYNTNIYLKDSIMQNKVLLFLNVKQNLTFRYVLNFKYI